MDTFAGVMNDPVSLHKYAYGNLDPINTIDPSGEFGLGSIGSALNAASRLVITSVRSGVSAASQFLRSGRINGMRVVASIRIRLWLHRTVGNIQAKLPKEIFGKGKLSKNKDGWRWGDEVNNVRIQRANPSSKYASQRVDYVQIRVDGKGIIGRNGQKIPSKYSDEAHIPLSEWRSWARWDSPL